MQSTVVLRQRQPAYLDPNRNIMQKPIRGLLCIGGFLNQSMLKSAEGKGTEKKIGAHLKNSTYKKV